MLKVRIYAHDRKLIFWPDNPAEGIASDAWIPVDQDGQRFGSVVCNTKQQLGISQEALDLMMGIACGRDAIGDVSWWWCENNTYALSWFGGLYRVLDPTDCIADRAFRPYPEECQIIDNDIPVEFIPHWATVRGDAASWREPFAVPAYELPDAD